MGVIRTSDFKEKLYSILSPYDSKHLNLMISGGSLLKDLDYSKYKDLDSSKWKIFFADERCNTKYLNFEGALPFIKSLDAMVYPILPICLMKEAKENCCNLRFDQSYECKCRKKENNPEECRKSFTNDDAIEEKKIIELRDRYEKIMSNTDVVKAIDICLLGIGDNGHICSLWPESESLLSNRFVENVNVDCPLSRNRITVTLKLLNELVKSLYFVIPPKKGKPQSVSEPHESIRKKITIKYDVILPEK